MADQKYTLNLTEKEARHLNDAITLVKDREDCAGFLKLHEAVLDLTVTAGDNELTKAQANFALGASGGHRSGDFMTGMGLTFFIYVLTLIFEYSIIKV